MKNGLLIWNVILTLLTGYLLLIHFNSGNSNTGIHHTAARDTTNNHGAFRIAFFEMDSVDANFNRVKEVKAELGRKEDAINNELESLGKKFQQRLNFYQSKAATMTQAESESASQELRNLEETIKNRKDALNQEYSLYASEKMKELKKQIEDFIAEYNQTRNYSYIIAEEPGLFYYKDSLYNITSDVISGLNERHRPSKKN